MTDSDTGRGRHPQIKDFPARMKWAQAVHRDSALTAPPKNAAFVLAMHVDRDSGACYPGLQRIGTEMGRGSNAAKDAVDALVKRGWLDRTRRNGQGTDYRLVFRNDEVCEGEAGPLADSPPPSVTEPLANSPPLPLAELPPPLLVTLTSTPGDFATPPLAELPPEQGLTGSEQSVEGDEEQGKANRPAAVGFAAIVGEGIAVRHDALSGSHAPPQGGQPDRAEGDQGEAVEVGDDAPFPGGDPVAYPGWERFPSVSPAPAFVVTPAQKAPRRVAPEDFDISSEKLERMRKNLRKERGLDMWAMVEQQNDLFVSLPKWKRDDLLKKIVDEAMRANDNDDLARDAG